jgi:predicted transcriptional regulator
MITATKPNKIMNGCRLEADMQEQLQAIADREFLTRSDIVRRAIRQNNG